MVSQSTIFAYDKALVAESAEKLRCLIPEMGKVVKNRLKKQGFDVGKRRGCTAGGIDMNPFIIEAVSFFKYLESS